MAEELFTGDLTHEMNWGDVYNDGSTQASGQAVQDYIKGPLINSRIGYLHSEEDTESNQNILYGFANKTKYEEWMASNQQNDSLYLSKTQLAKADPQPYYYFALRSTEEAINGSINYVSIDDTVKMDLIFVAQYYEASGSGGLTPTPQLVSGNIEMQIWNNSLNRWEDADLSQVNTFIESTTDNSTTTIDLTPAFGGTSGKYRIQIRVAGEYGDGERFTTTWLQYNITKTKVDFSFATLWQNPVPVSGFDTYKYINLNYHITGAVDKVLTLKITGVGGSEGRTVTKKLSSNENYPITSNSLSIKIEDDYGDNDLYKITQNGIHNIEAYVTAYYNDVQLAESEHLYSRIYVTDTDQNDNNIYITLNNINKNLVNWATNKLFEYSICGNGDLSSLSLQLIDINDNNNIYINQPLDIEKGSINTCNLSLDIDTSDNEIGCSVYIVTNNNELYRDAVVIDNSGGYSPYEGAQFIFNPKKYNNSTFDGLSGDYKYIINESNIVNNKIISATFTGFEFANDGFTEDEDGNKCFRVLGGQEFTINDFKPFKNNTLDSVINNNCVIEFVYAIRNIRSIPNNSKITDEDRPLIRVNNKSGDNAWDGLEIRPYVGLFRTQANNDTLAQDVWLAGDKMINLIISITTKQVVFYINGIVNRIFSIKDGAAALNRLKEVAIIIGNKDSKTDIDIYNIRVYQDNVNINNSYNNLLRNYISSLPTINEKEKIKQANEIISKTDGGVEYIDYDKCCELGYNSLVWRPLSEKYSKDYVDNLNGFNVVGLAHGHNEDTKIAGDLEIRIYKEKSDGTRELDKLKSGTIKNLRVKGQGTSSMGYWKWNQRWEFDKLEVDNKYLGELTEDVDWEEDEGKNLLFSKFYPLILEDNTLSEELREEYTTKYVKNSYQIADGDPFAKRLDAKINWASPMQSHKLGSVNLYNDIWKDVIGTSAIVNYEDPNKRGVEFTGTAGGYNDCRVAIRQLPFILFVQNNPNDMSSTAKKFYGLFTMGPSKGDKPTFGHNKKDFPDYIMMEGMDNGALLANCAIPWNDVDITPDSKYEYYTYQGKSDSGGLEAIGSWEISMGEKEKASIVDLTQSTSNPVIHKFKELINFCYTCKTNTVAFNGTFEEFDGYCKGQISNPPVEDKTSNRLGITNDNMYWMCNGDKRYHLYRFDDRIGTSGGWVDAGINPRGIDESGAKQYEVYNLFEHGDDILKAKLNSSSLSFKEKNNEVIKYRIRRYKGSIDTTRNIPIGNDLSIPATIGGIGDYVEVADLLYSLQMLKLIAASDNWAKNTYIYNPGIYEKDMKGDIVRTHGKDSGSIKKGDIVKVNETVEQYGMARLATDEEKSNPNIQKYKLVSKFRFFQDDMDTIFSLDNTGKKVKQYYVDENDLDSTGAPCWNASQNPLFKNAYYAWDDPDFTYNDKNKDDTSVNNMMTMMKSILISMSEKGKNNIGEDNVLNCWDKYYGAVTKYIPAYAYNEIVKSLYEDAHNNKILNNYTQSIEPYTQCVGDQYISEKEWFRKRSVLFSSYAQHGVFSAADGSTSEGALVFRSYAPGGKKPSYKYTVTYNQYIWPSAGKGQAPIRVSPWKRYEPGEPAALDLGSTDGNTNIFIRGINHIDSISDFGGTIVAADVNFIMSGDKLTNFKASELGAKEVYPSDNNKDYHGYLLFNPPSLEFNGMKSLRSIEITGNTKFNEIAGSISLLDHTVDTIDENNNPITKNIAGSRNVEKIDLSGTSITSLILPVPNVVSEVKLPNTITTIDLTESKKLTNEKLIVGSYDKVTSVTIKNCPLFDEYTFINDNFIKQNISLNDLTLHNINWTGRKQINIEFLQKILEYNDLSLTGIIEIADGDLDSDLKSELLNRFGEIDNEENALYVKYDIKRVNEERVRINGPANIYTVGDHKFTLSYPSEVGSANDFTNIKWSVVSKSNTNSVDLSHFEVNEKGLLTIDGQFKFENLGENPQITLRCEITRMPGLNGVQLSKIVIDKDITLTQPLAKIGDYLYADKTYGPPVDDTGEKSIVGICIYADDTDEVKTQRRIAVATNMIKSEYNGDTKSTANCPFWGRYENRIYDDFNNANTVAGATAMIMSGYNMDATGAISTDPSWYHDNSMYLINTSNSNFAPTNIISSVINEHSNYKNNGYNSNKYAILDFGFIKDNDVFISKGIQHTNDMLNEANNLRNNDGLNLRDLDDWQDKLVSNYDKYAESKFEFINMIFKSVAPNDGSGNISNTVYIKNSYYYPAAQYCHAYQPNVNDLHNDLKEGNWFLPSAGELARAYIYAAVNPNDFKDMPNYARGYSTSFSKLKELIKNDIANSLNLNGNNFYSDTCVCWSSSESSKDNKLDNKPCAFAIGYNSSNGNLEIYGANDGRGYTFGSMYGEKYNCYNLWPMICF